LALAPNSVVALTGMVRSHLLMKQVDAAVVRLKAVIKKTPDNVYAHNLLGEVYASDKASEDAKRAFSRATELRNTWTLPYVNWSRLVLAEGKPKDAIVVIQRGLKASPKDATLLFTLATAQQAAKDYDGAIATYSAMLEGNPKMDAAANNMAALVADHRYDNAETLEKALAVAQRFQTSENPFYLDTLGWLLYRKGDYSLAVVTLKRAVDELPDHPYLNFHLGMAYYKSGQAEQAKPHLEKAVAQADKYPEIIEAKKILESL
jgi:predicted Zn-dependent protease